MKISHVSDALYLVEAGAQELALIPQARAIAARGGNPFEASLNLHIAIHYARAARRAIARAEREMAAGKRT